MSLTTPIARIILNPFEMTKKNEKTKCTMVAFETRHQIVEASHC